MKKTFRTLLALVLTAAVIAWLAREGRPRERPREEPALLRVWLLETDPAVASWLRGLAPGYEKETKQRVYLRAATAEEAAAARAGEGIRPDLVLQPGEDAPVALRGYALILRDDARAAATPAPTSALFFPPPVPSGPSPAPAPTAAPNAFSAVLAPEEMMHALPGTVRSENPAGDLALGKAQAALLTAGQAERASFGYQAYPVPGAAGGRGISAQAFSPAGEAFRAYLAREDSQRALRRAGLYSPVLRLYGPEDPLRALIEASLFSPDQPP